MAYTTINKGSLYINTVLYSGNNTSQSITGVGFQPDWVWLKERNGTEAHNLYDSNRGIFKRLSSNTTGAEYSSNTQLTAFGNDGFSVGSSDAINDAGNTMVGWNWKAGGTAPAQTYSVKVVSDSGNKYRFDDFGTSAVTINLQEGGTYTFDQSDSSNNGHPLRFATQANGANSSQYTTGVTTNGTPGQAGAYTRITVAASAPTLFYYCTAHSGMGGQANTNTTFGSSNFSGSIQSTVSASPTAGFSIVSWTGSGSNATIGHGLGSVPKMIIVKNREAVTNWIVGGSLIEDVGGSTNNYLLLNTNAAMDSATTLYASYNTDTIGVKADANINGSNNGMLAYCFAEIKGYSKFGSYVGNGSTDGPFIFTGFKPAFVLIKKSNASGTDWQLTDNKRDLHNVCTHRLLPNDSIAEQTDSLDLDILSNGFKIRKSSTTNNASGATYIYLAFAENPFVGSDGTPVTAR